MTGELKAALVAICIILGSVFLRVPKKTATKWWLTVVFAAVGGLAGFWVEPEPLAALLGAASGAISPWLIRTIITALRKVIRARGEELSGGKRD